MNTASPDHPGNLHFITGGGAAGALIRNMNWETTPMGRIEQWPGGLLSALAIALNSVCPMCIFWGKDQYCFYNDAFTIFLEEGKSGLMGKPAKEVLGSAWSTIFLQADDIIRTGAGVRPEDHVLPAYGKTGKQEMSCSLSYGPLYDTVAAVKGVLLTCLHTPAGGPSASAMGKRSQESGENLRKLLSQAPVSMTLLVGPEFIVSIANPRALSIWGKTAEEAIGKPILEVLPEIRSQGYEELLRKVYTTGKGFYTYGKKLSLQREGKTQEIYVSFNYEPYRDTDGNIAGVMSVSTDVTAEVTTKQKMEQSERNFRSMVQQAPVAMCIMTGPEHVMEVANDHMIELLGKPAESIMQKPVFEAMPDAREQGLEELLAGVYTTGETYVADARPVVLLRKGRLETVYQNFVCAPYRDANGAMLGVLAVSVDVTEQVLSRKKIEEAEEKARLAIHSAELGVYEVTYADDKTLTDSRFKEIWGIGRDAERNEYAAAIHPEDRERRKAAHELSLVTGHLDYQARILWEDGSIHWVRVTGRVLYNDDGSPLKLIGIVQDITAHIVARQKTEEEVAERTRELAEAIRNLQKSNSELAQFAYIASHDLQEPLRKISTFTQMLGNRIEKQIDEQTRGYLEKINSSSIRMNTLIRDVLNYSELGRGDEMFKSVDLNKVLESTLADYDLRIEQLGALTKYDRLPGISAIPSQMQQLFANIIGNSLKFARKDLKPVIRISCTELSEEEKRQAGFDPAPVYYHIRFSDNGIGLKPEYREQIFNIFQRLHRKSEYEGTGIGLAMCKKIALNHHGDLNAVGSSEAGAVFNLFLPLKQP